MLFPKKKHLYSPKISEDLIPKLYRISKSINQPMTKVVDKIIREYIKNNKELNNV